MTILRRLACVSLPCLWLLTAPVSAQASCNTIPNSGQMLGATPEGQKIAATIPADLGYRGAFGRIDGALMAGSSGFVLGPDDHCLSDAQQQRNSEGRLRLGDVQAMILYEPPNDLPQALFYSSNDGCTRIRNKFADDDEIELLGCEDARRNLRISAPSARESDRVALRGSPDARAGAVTIVVISAAAERVEDFHLEELLGTNCAGLGDDFGANPQKHFCIDTIYDDYQSRCEVNSQFAAVVPANLLNLPPKNDFQEHCIDSQSPAPGLAPCTGTPTELAFAEDDQGNAYFPFDYTKILAPQPEDGPDLIPRILSGLTATGRKEMGTDPKIFIPGREFVGSTPYGDPNGRSTDWRRPLIDIHQPSDRPEEFGLIGTADKANSIIHVYPRLPVGWRCDSLFRKGEACMAVEQSTAGGVEGCAKQDRWGATCIALLVPEYAACNGGPRDGMPCTRPAQCGFLGACNGEAKCQKKKAVWDPDENDDKNDDKTACKMQSDCKANERCGYALFDLKDRSSDKLVYKVEKGKKVRRGVCEDDRKAVCSSANGGKSCGGGKTCVGYYLEAGGRN